MHFDHILHRFLLHVAPEPNCGCWLWVGSYRGEYGRLKFDGVTHAAHRLSFEIFNGPIPIGLHVLHRCDVTICVNPAHLFVGTEADNHADKAAKGRSAKGTRNARAKLTDKAVLAIFAAVGRQQDIASRFRVPKATVCHIKSGRQWSSVTGAIFSPSRSV